MLLSSPTRRRRHRRLDCRRHHRACIKDYRISLFIRFRLFLSHAPTQHTREEKIIKVEH